MCVLSGIAPFSYGQSGQPGDRGKVAVPVVSGAMTSNDSRVRIALVTALAGNGSDESTKVLFQTALKDTDPNVAAAARNSLEGRIIREPIAQTNFLFLCERINSGDLGEASTWARIVAKAELPNKEIVADLLVKRFVREAKNPIGPNKQLSMGGYLGIEVRPLNDFLLAFIDLSAYSARPLGKAYESAKRSQNPHLRKWLALALGMVGVDTVAGELKEIIASNDNSSVRAIALRAYAIALGRRSIPLLENYANDETPGPNPRHPPIRVVARDELRRLEKLPR